MGITTTVGDRKVNKEIGGVTNNTTTSKSKKNRRRPRKTMQQPVSPVQRLFDTCREVFAECRPGVVPPPGDVERVKAVLDVMRPEDVGLNPEMPYFRNKAVGRSSIIAYVHLHECDKFSIGVFCLPPSGVIPLHNHPGMTVFSKLLFGTMHIKAYDWVVDGSSSISAVISRPQSVPDGARLARVKVDSEFTAPCETSILYPADGGNMHCFTALTACAFLDVLGPPYSDPDGRHCTYYRDLPFSSFSVDDGASVPEEERERYAWLQEKEKPEDCAVVGVPYRGPTITGN